MSDPEKEKRTERRSAPRPAAQAEETALCDYCGRETRSPLAWEEEEGLWLCEACRLELGSCGCSD